MTALMALLLSDVVLLAWVAWLLHRNAALVDRADAAETEIARRNERLRQQNRAALRLGLAR